MASPKSGTWCGFVLSHLSLPLIYKSNPSIHVRKQLAYQRVGFTADDLQYTFLNSLSLLLFYNLKWSSDTSRQMTCRPKNPGNILLDPQSELMAVLREGGAKRESSVLLFKLIMYSHCQKYWHPCIPGR